MLFCFLQVFIVLISISCGRTGNELQKMKSTSFDLLTELGVHPKTTKEEVMCDQLNLFFSYMNNRNCNISAAGFFDVNFNLFYLTCGCAAGYIVICLQFA